MLTDAKLQSSGKSFKGKGRLYNLQAFSKTDKLKEYIVCIISNIHSLFSKLHIISITAEQREFSQIPKKLFTCHMLSSTSQHIYLYFKHFDICLLHHSHPTLRSILLHTCLLDHECRVWECEKSDVYLISYSQSF